jgi:sorbitol/mannitol transport system permease protein
VVFLFFFPVLWMIFTSFKSEQAAAQFPPSFITHLSFDRYVTVFQRGMGLYLANSAALSILSTIGVMALAIPAAYGLSVRRVGRWQDLLFFFISTKFMPIAASIIPVFLLLRVIGALDNLWALGVLYVGMNLPLAIWMMRSFFAEVPYAVVEAAQIDGLLQPGTLAGVAADCCARRGGRSADLLHLRLERVFPGQPADRGGGAYDSALPG